MAFQNVNYQPIQSDNEELGEDLPPTVVTTRGSENSGRWNHIENLDDFFTRIYEYHQNQGFTCMLLSELLELVQYVFIVMFTTFLIICLDYKALFKDPSPTWSKVVHLHKFNRMPAGMVICLCVAFFFWTVRLLRVIKHLCKAWQIREFYYTALNISNNELQNMQWHEVQRKLIEVQKIHHMCVHKAELTELDIYNRILRRKNYLIAMLNKAVIPCIYRFPFLGHRTFLTHGLKYNLKLILFSGPGSPFQTNWKLKPEYKDNVQKRSLANSLSRRIFLLGIANLVLCPFILIYQILYSFFRYAEIVKRAPDFFGSRMWSSYGRLYLRHFNELDHQFQARLSKAYEPATKYMNSFVSPLATVIAKNIAFFAGAMLAVLLAFSFYDQDVLKAEHVISTMAALGMIIKGCTAFIPEENFLWCPEQYMKEVLTHTHYIPDHWKGKAHTSDVREQFSRLFQYKMRFAQLLAPETNHVTSNLKVEVTGVGDVCSFAQLDVRRHGNPSMFSYLSRAHCHCHSLKPYLKLGERFLLCSHLSFTAGHSLKSEKIGPLILLNCEAESLTAFITTMCLNEQKSNDNLIVKDYCFIILRGCFSRLNEAWKE